MQRANLFERIAPFYDLSLKFILFGFENKLRKKTLSKIPKDAKNVADFACGTGTLTILLAEKHKNVYGVDFSREMLKRAIKKAKRKNLKIKFLLQDIRKLKLKKDFFDAATISLAFHEIPEEDREIATKEIKETLKKGGKFVVFDLHKPKSIILRALQKLFFKIAEEYADSFIEIDFTKFLKHLNFKNIKKETVAFGLFQIISAEK